MQKVVSLQKIEFMLNFIVFKGNAIELVSKLIGIDMKYFFGPMSPNVNDNKRDFCREVKVWIEESLDTCFSNIKWVIQNCNEVISSKYDIPNQAFIEVFNFVTTVKLYWVFARCEDDMPSCKHLLNFSPKEIVKKEKDLIQDGWLKQAIKQALNLDTALNVINVMRLADYYACLLTSINGEIWKCHDDPWGNKRRLHNKFSKELDYCVQVLCKIGQEVVCDKFKKIIERNRHTQNDSDNNLNSIAILGLKN